VREVRAGRDWLITDRGRPVARLVAITLGDLSLKTRLRRLEAMGLVEPRPPQPRLPSPIAPPETRAE
jgi:antitoxin (DNA-binding transcriptional repressor) of toxin-antitoxin stability system